MKARTGESAGEILEAGLLGTDDRSIKLNEYRRCHQITLFIVREA